ncbi:MAG TPA: phosphoribosylanthranilate isomerase [Verrucomicrobiales bacterium]|nr:phosphoribosylanthranilate isomerase [Verrucomicrobiales bacterium]
MKVRVKICGITSLRDAMVAVEAGADALGFVFYNKSPRHVTPAKAARIIRQLPPFVSRVGLFVNAPVEEIRSTADAAGLDTLQLHGDETPGFCHLFSLPVLKAIRVESKASLRGLKAYDVSAILLDAFVAGTRGGTGKTFDWRLAREAKANGTPVIVAGGLTPENVGEAVRRVSPYGVDVSSGVELAPGRKDARKVRAFIAAARQG